MRKTWLATAGVVVLALCAVGLWLALGREQMPKGGVWEKFEAGNETTRISEPRMADGRIDYSRALDGMLQQGVTAENNGGAVMWAALGRKWPEGVPGGPAKGVRDVGFVPLFGDRVTPAMKQGEEIYGHIDKRAVWEAGDYPLVAAWLEQHKDALTALDSASRLERFYLPGGSRVDEVNAVMLQCSRACEGLWLRACLRAGQGDLTGARADLGAGHRFARLLVRSEASMGYALAHRLERRLWMAQVAVMGAARTPEQRATLLAEAQAWPEIAVSVDRLRVHDRYAFLEMVMTTMAEGPERLLGIHTLQPLEKDMRPGAETASLPRGQWEEVDWNVVLRSVNRWADRLDGLSRQTPQERRRGMRELTAQLQDGVPGSVLDAMLGILKGGDAGLVAERDRIIAAWEEFLKRREGETREAFSERVAVLFIGGRTWLPDSQAVTEKIRCNHRMGLTMMAVEAFSADKGRLPTRLEELVPGYLPEVPADVFGEGAVKYRVEDGTYVVYSVGENGRDDGGKRVYSSKENGYAQDDLTLLSGR